MIKVGKGETLELEVSQLDEDGSPVPFNDHVITFSLYVDGASTPTYSEQYAGDENGFRVKVEETETGEWNPGEYVYLITDTFTAYKENPDYDPDDVDSLELIPDGTDVKWVVQDRLKVKGPGSLD